MKASLTLLILAPLFIILFLSRCRSFTSFFFSGWLGNGSVTLLFVASNKVMSNREEEEKRRPVFYRGITCSTCVHHPILLSDIPECPQSFTAGGQHVSSLSAPEQSLRAYVYGCGYVFPSNKNRIEPRVFACLRLLE